MVVLFPWIISKLVSCIGGGADSPIIFLSFVWQLCFLGQSFIMARGGEKKKKWRLYFHLICFSPKLESRPLLLHHLGSYSTKVQGLPWVGNASASAPAVGSNLRTGHGLQVQQLVDGICLVPLGLETHTFFFSQGSLGPARFEYRKDFWFFRNSIFRQRWKKAKQI